VFLEYRRQLHLSNLKEKKSDMKELRASNQILLKEIRALKPVSNYTYAQRVEVLARDQAEWERKVDDLE